jgi:hypothetical protein
MLVCVACFLLYSFYGADKDMSFERNFFTACVVIDDHTLFGQKGKYFVMDIVYPATSNLDGM